MVVNCPPNISKTKDKRLYYNEDINIVKEIKNLNLYQKMPLKQIEKVMKDKYPNKNLKWGKSSVERILKNPIYQGIITYNKKEYKFLEPLFTKEEINLINNKDKVYRQVKTTKYYKYHYKLFYENEKMYPTTTTKFLKTKNKMQEIIYYVSRDRKVSINEKILDNLLNEALAKHNFKITNTNSKKLDNLKKLFVMEDITLDEYNNMKKDLESKNSLNLNNISKLSINKELKVTIYFTNGQIKRFQYIKMS